DFISNIHVSNERMIELVESLLNVSRLESGRILLDLKPTSLESLLKEVLVELEPRIILKRQNLNSQIAENLPLVNVDPKLLRQVLSNLITNAVKYTPEEGRLSVKLNADEKNIRFEIQDSGIGIPKHEQDKVFEKFFRAENTSALEATGTGLGLYLVKLLIHEFKGELNFESEEGNGTTFWFTLPLQ
ncbi:MAG: ATP-binding protein, partial [Patescibacteria group bacterium]